MADSDSTVAEDPETHRSDSEDNEAETFAAVTVIGLGQVIVEVLVGFSSSLRDMVDDMDSQSEVARVSRWADLIDSTADEIVTSMCAKPGTEISPQMLAALLTPETPNDDDSP
ncbi:hypothetical protein [Mollivirus kamchatka]|nr:hypothetical protein [Mollivirus kamchatka]